MAYLVDKDFTGPINGCSYGTISIREILEYVEKKIAALEAYEVEAPKPDEAAYQKLKESVQRANAEAADYKRQLREKQTEAERAEAERAEREKAVQEELARYRTNERISGYQAKLMAAGYDAETAQVMATALPEGIGDIKGEGRVAAGMVA